ncbi:CGNR zinc finger domain-containing protein [Nonomuraea typhae]|uniref:CGNR zinc finger domain-containing protein n=1 Tax=Nonomuraea typhae TaxID=2603600 RepID=UPI0012FAB9FA|nr:ABATE domain-containing protein [Nonomuraea typhae]
MDAWIRDGGRVCLDFANTLRDRWKEPRETLTSGADLARWLYGAGLLSRVAAAGDGLPDGDLSGDDLSGDGLLEEARRLREALDRAVQAAAHGTLPDETDLALLNTAVARAPRPPVRIMITGGRLAAETPPGMAGTVPAALGLVALDAAGLLLSAEIRRVRVCASDRCALRFVDGSPTGNRRWCSMARCGNRTKVRRHAARGR